MKSFLYSVCLLPMLMYAGGDFLPVVDTQYDEIPVVPIEAVLPVTKEKIIKKPKLIIKTQEVERAKVTKRLEVKRAKIKPTSKFYGGVSVAYMNNNGETNRVIMYDSNPYALIVKAGYNIIDNLAIEGHVGIGIKNENNIPSASVDNEFQNLWAIYLKPNINIINNVNLHALAGYATTKQTVNTTDIDTKDFSYGAGIGYALTDNMEIVLDAIRYANKTDSKVDAYAIGLDFKF